MERGSLREPIEHQEKKKPTARPRFHNCEIKKKRREH